MKKLLLENNDYINSSMKSYIAKSNLIYHREYKNFTIWGYSMANDKTIFIECGKRINTLYNDLKKDFNKKVKFLNIVLIDCPDIRKFIDHYYYVNGGLTYLLDNILYVYRAKEMCKVVLHEMIHHAFYFKDTDVFLGDPIRDKVTIDFNEALVEFLATIYHLKYCKKSLQTELKHSLKNFKCVINMPNITFNTKIYSYIVIKHLLLKRSKFVLKCIKTNKYDLIYQYVHKVKINKINKYKPIKELFFVSP